MSSESLHENPEALGAEVIDTHRAIVSLMEELEALAVHSSVLVDGRSTRTIRELRSPPGALNLLIILIDDVPCGASRR